MYLEESWLRRPKCNCNCESVPVQSNMKYTPEKEEIVEPLSHSGEPMTNESKKDAPIEEDYAPNKNEKDNMTDKNDPPLEEERTESNVNSESVAVQSNMKDNASVKEDIVEEPT